MIVADTGPLIAFIQIGRLDLLGQVVGSLIIPDAVYEELVTGGQGESRPARPSASELSPDRPHSPESPPWHTLRLLSWSAPPRHTYSPRRPTAPLHLPALLPGRC